MLKEDASANPTGCKLHLMQFKLLLKKNWNVKRRNRQSTLMQFLVPFIVNFALFIISVDDKYNPNGYNARTWSTTQPDVTTVGGLPTCMLERMPSCITPLSIVHNPADDASANFVSEVVASMLAANDHIDAGSVRYFNSSLALNLVLHENPNALLAAVHFSDDFKLTALSLGASEVTLQYNQTRSCVFGVNDCSVPWRDVALPLQLAVETALIGKVRALRPVRPVRAVSCAPCAPRAPCGQSPPCLPPHPLQLGNPNPNPTLPSPPCEPTLPQPLP